MIHTLFLAVYSCSIKDENIMLSLVMDSSHGISSQKDGELEVMLHRVLLRDDGRGVLFTFEIQYMLLL